MADIKIAERNGRWWPDKGEAFITKYDGKDTLIMRCPRCGQPALLADHQLTVEADGSPTISPSIGCQQCHYHAYLKAGKLEVLTDF